MDIIVLLQQAVLNHASDIFVVAGLPVSYRANGRICREKEEKLMPPQTKECVEELYKLAGGRDIRVLEEKGDDDFSFAVPGLSRFRVSAYKQRGALSAVIRVITFELPEPNEIGIPDPVMSFYNLSKGLVLVTARREVENLLRLPVWWIRSIIQWKSISLRWKIRSSICTDMIKVL